MEGVPNEMPNNEEKELSFEQQTALAKVLFDAVNKRNSFTDSYGGFDDFADVHQHVGDNRKIFDEMEVAVINARKEFDEKVSDKKQFVENLRNSGEVKMADMMEIMFSVGTKKQTPKTGIFSKLFNKNK